MSSWCVLQVVLRLNCLVADLCSPRLQELHLGKSVTATLVACYRQLNRCVGGRQARCDVCQPVCSCMQHLAESASRAALF